MRAQPRGFFWPAGKLPPTRPHPRRPPPSLVSYTRPHPPPHLNALGGGHCGASLDSVGASHYWSCPACVVVAPMQACCAAHAVDAACAHRSVLPSLPRRATMLVSP